MQIIYNCCMLKVEKYITRVIYVHHLCTVRGYLSLSPDCIVHLLNITYSQSLSLGQPNSKCKHKSSAIQECIQAKAGKLFEPKGLYCPLWSRSILYACESLCGMLEIGQGSITNWFSFEPVHFVLQLTTWTHCRGSSYSCKTKGKINTSFLMYFSL